MQSYYTLNGWHDPHMKQRCKLVSPPLLIIDDWHTTLSAIVFSKSILLIYRYTVNDLLCLKISEYNFSYNLHKYRYTISNLLCLINYEYNSATICSSRF